MDKMALGIRDVDLSKLFADFDKILTNNTAGLRSEINRVAINIESAAKQNVIRVTGKLGYKVTGDLSSSIMPNYSDNGMSVVVGTAKHYAPYVEFGTGSL